MLLFLNKNWSKLLLIIFFVAAFLGFLTFEKVLLFKIAASLLVLASIWRLVKDKRLDWLILIILFLGFFSLYSLYLGVNWSLALMMLAVLLLSGGLYFISLEHKTILSYVLTSLFAILELEIFLSLIPWPIDPKGKSLILVGCFYFFREMIKLKEEKNLSGPKVLGLVILILIIFSLVVFTSSWYRR